MKTQAIILTQYGEPNHFAQSEIQLPDLKDNEVLVAVRATSYNPADKWLRTGALQEFYPFEMPIVLGWDMAGVVVATGSQVKDFGVGDEVSARVPTQRFGSYAHNVIVPSDVLAKKPSAVSFEQASAVAMVGVTAYQAMDFAQIQPNSRVLIHGGAGSVGSLLVQFAKAQGAFVVTTASTDDIAKVKALGAGEVIDYKKQDFKNIDLVDVVIDTVGAQTLADSLMVVKQGGLLMSVAENISETLQQQADSKQVRTHFVLAQNNAEQLQTILNQLAEQKLQFNPTQILPLTCENVMNTHLNPKGKTVFVVE
ncbi:NADP-dependent oxidoreductase [Actinobacillus capsulatus]|uniref:NADP-dependent oxidoreductase n=1 Tax=Actinobacillus capsulatus TaxID=717 RepID=UPI00039B4E29|nr:NADP-dependent oxidoreductase [Actinobacillus capsulatus]